MSYQVLARKWRPQQFNELLGQQHVKSALSNALSSDRLHHAYLFTGTRGVGKTTIARIFAKSLNCEHGVSATPCGKCSSCTEIEAGRFVDLLEIDAASRTKVEDTRDLLDNVQYAPTRGRFKVYLIDEVHMLSRHSFNALLKTLEEPPPHVKFLLATTDPQKLPVTVLSRCLQFSLKALTDAEIQQQLQMVLQHEQVQAEAEALSLLAKAARGSVRDALSLTDQAIAQTNGQITAVAVRDMLGLLPQHWGQRVLDTLLQQDVAALRQQLDALMLQSSQPELVLDDLLALLHFAAICQFQPEAAALADEQAAYVTELAASQDAETLQLYYQLLISGKKELPFAPDVRAGLEMALLRALLFVPATSEPAAQPPVTRSGLGATVGREPAAKKPEAIGSQAVSGKRDELTAAERVTEPAAELVGVPQSELLTDTVNDTVSDSAAQATLQSELTTTAANAGKVLAIDPITASIIARRGLDARLPEQATAQSMPALPEPPQQAAADRAEALATEANAHQEQATKTAAAEVTTARSPEASFEAIPSAAKPVQTSQAAEPASSVAPGLAESTSEQGEPIPVSTAVESSPAPLIAEGAAQQLLAKPLDATGFECRHAHQVDGWAQAIEQLQAGGLYRLFLINAVPKVQGDQVQLTVAESERHLDKPEFRARIEQLVMQAFPGTTSVAIDYQVEVPDCPRAIQQRLDEARRCYVADLMEHDAVVQSLRQSLSAELIPDSLVVN